MDIEELYFDLQQFKSERAWYNLNLSKAGIPKLLTDCDWYVLYIPQEEMEAGLSIKCVSGKKLLPHCFENIVTGFTRSEKPNSRMIILSIEL